MPDRLQTQAGLRLRIFPANRFGPRPEGSVLRPGGNSRLRLDRFLHLPKARIRPLLPISIFF
jgi:hypothetical protein